MTSGKDHTNAFLLILTVPDYNASSSSILRVGVHQKLGSLSSSIYISATWTRPLGPLLFALALHEVVATLGETLQASADTWMFWYLDEGTVFVGRRSWKRP